MRPCLPILAALAVLTGCVKYRPKPIEPPRLEQEYRARSLPRPGAFDAEALAKVAAQYSPDLEIARARVRTAEAAVETAKGRPNPSLSVGGGYTDSPESALVFHFDPGLTIETAGKRGKRILLAEQQAEAAQLDLAEAEWQVRSRVRAALLGHLFAVREVELLVAEERVRSEAVRMIERRLEVGEVSRPDVDVAATERDSARVALAAARGRAAETLASLAAALRVPVLALKDARFEWRGLDEPPRAEDLPLAAVQRAGVLHRIDVRRALVEYAVAETALRLDVARQVPDIQVSPGYSFDEGHHKFTLGPSLAVPVLNRNRGPIAESSARREEAAARFSKVQADAIAEMELALARYGGALEELAEAGRLADLQERRLSSVRRALEGGETDRLALAGAEVQQAVLARARLEALRKTQAALAAMENAVQAPLESRGKP